MVRYTCMIAETISWVNPPSLDDVRFFGMSHRPIGETFTLWAFIPRRAGHGPAMSN